MPITDRFLNFLKVELNDFLGKYDDEHAQQSSKSSSWTDKVSDYFSGESSKKEETTQSKAQDQWRSRQQRRSRTYSRQQEKEQKYSYQENNSSGFDFSNEEKYYQALEIMPGASFEEIKAAYKKTMKKYHPDRFATDPQKQHYAKQLSQKVNEAYEYFKKKHNIN